MPEGIRRVHVIISILDDGCIWVGPPLVSKFIYLSIYMNILQSKIFCTECIFDLAYILFTDLIKAYVFLFLFYSILSLKIIFEDNNESLGNKKIKVQEVFKFTLPITIIFVIFRYIYLFSFQNYSKQKIHNFTKTGLFYITIVMLVT